MKLKTQFMTEEYFDFIISEGTKDLKPQAKTIKRIIHCII